MVMKRKANEGLYRRYFSISIDSLMVEFGPRRRSGMLCGHGYGRGYGSEYALLHRTVRACRLLAYRTRMARGVAHLSEANEGERIIPPTQYLLVQAVDTFS